MTFCYTCHMRWNIKITVLIRRIDLNQFLVFLTRLYEWKSKRASFISFSIPRGSVLQSFFLWINFYTNTKYYAHLGILSFIQKFFHFLTFASLAQTSFACLRVISYRIKATRYLVFKRRNGKWTQKIKYWANLHCQGQKAAEAYCQDWPQLTPR